MTDQVLVTIAPLYGDEPVKLDENDRQDIIKAINRAGYNTHSVELVKGNRLTAEAKEALDSLREIVTAMDKWRDELEERLGGNRETIRYWDEYDAGMTDWHEDVFNRALDLAHALEDVK